MTDLKRVYIAPSEETALYELENFGKKWTQSRRGWEIIHSQLEIYFSERIN